MLVVVDGKRFTRAKTAECGRGTNYTDVANLIQFEKRNFPVSLSGEKFSRIGVIN